MRRVSRQALRFCSSEATFGIAVPGRVLSARFLRRRLVRPGTRLSMVPMARAPIQSSTGPRTLRSLMIGRILERILSQSVQTFPPATLTTISITLANPAVVTWASNGPANGQSVIFANSGGSLPQNITAGTVYYVIAASGDAFEISQTYNGSAISTLGNTQSGIQTAGQAASPTTMRTTSGISCGASRRLVGAHQRRS